MNVVEGSAHGDSVGVGLVEMAPELIHKVALSGYLTFSEVNALSQTCRRMKSIIVDDDYGRDIHYALKGVMENVKGKRWKAAEYAMSRRWYEGGEETLWREVAEVVVGGGVEKIQLASEEDLTGWENVLLAGLALPGASGGLGMWGHMRYGWLNKTSVLHLAAWLGGERVVDWVVEQSGDLERKNERALTPLFVACRAGRLGVVKRLVEAGADMMTMGEFEMSLAHGASQSGNVVLLRYVLELGVLDVEEVDSLGRTPLVVACECGYFDVVKMLVEEWSVGVDVKDEEGRNVARGPLSCACGGGNLEMVRLLVDAGSGSDVGKDEEGGVWVEGLVGAAKGGHVDVVVELIGMGVAVDAVDGADTTALCRASWNGHVDVVRVLLEAGADVNKAAFMERTALHWACMGRKEEVVSVLLEAGADVGVVNCDGHKPVDVAKRNRWRKGVRVLKAWGGGE